MEITRIIRRNPETNELDINISLNEEQVKFFINFAIQTLIQQGVISYLNVDQDGNPVAIDQDAAEAAELSKDVDTSKLN